MAQPDDTRRTASIRPPNSPASKSSRKQTSPHSQRRLLAIGEGSSWSFNSSLKPRKNHDHDDHHNKKSVFMKVKEKARKLKKSLSVRKQHREENELRSPYATPPGTARRVDDEKERPEYFGSPSYKSTVAPDTNKQAAAKEHSGETNKGSPEKHKITSNVDQKKQERPSTIMSAPSSVVGSTDGNDSKLSASSREDTAACDANKPESCCEAKENTRSSQQPQDKGISVKEYLMHKLEPGEDERALSQVITQTISPRCERMKEAMNSLLGNEEPSQSTSKTSNAELDVSPAAASNSNRNVGVSSSTESPNRKPSSLAACSNLSHSLESNLSNASNISQCSTSTSASCQNQTLEPNSGPNHSNSNPNPSSVHVNTNDNAATRVPTSTRNHEESKDDNGGH